MESSLTLSIAHATQESTPMISDQQILDKIYMVRGQKVMLDSDLAELYGVKTKRLKEQVKRNPGRFPPGYMFELTFEETDTLRSQFATSKSVRGGNRYASYAFSEHGVLQLANVLRSERAEKVSFIIIDVFVRFRTMLFDHSELRVAIEEIKRKTENNSRNIELVFQYLDELLEKKQKPRKAIGYKTKIASGTA